MSMFTYDECGAWTRVLGLGSGLMSKKIRFFGFIP